ncbi:hypothetical protein RRG08_043762 [Elysia crispata]|uniref:Uncharacterized protein n=1 Tax=Elysia crispata TaxID=231223 RepID=A0AAE1DJ99_9GAST|nr:hypothetical protein RRG08_043762 [Elysia crispata]
MIVSCSVFWSVNQDNLPHGDSHNCWESTPSPWDLGGGSRLHSQMIELRLSDYTRQALRVHDRSGEVSIKRNGIL